MKHITNRITALVLVLLMTASLLASCSEGEEKESESADTYLGENVDLGLSENETLMDIIEVGGEIRATVGVTSEEMEAKYGTEYGTPYKTEYRYYDMEFVEDTAKREPTASFHEIAQHYDPSLNLTIGGEPYLYTDENGVETSYGVRYQLYKDGQPIGDYINPRGANGYGRYTKYNARANLTMIEDAPFIWMDYTDFNFEIYIKDHFLQTTEISPDVIISVDGIVEIGGTTYVLAHGEQYDWSDMDSYFFAPVWKATQLTSITPETTELSLKGIEIEGVPTGGAFSDGIYGYYLCGSELWRTDGKTSNRIADLLFCGVDANSFIRTVRLLSEGRILVVADGNLVVLTESESVVPAKKNLYTIGTVGVYDVDELNLTVSKFNNRSTTYKFIVKEYKDATKMNLALLSGEVDIIATTDQFMLNNYIKQGLLAPLEEVAPELFEEGVLIENVVDATRVDGVCYYLPRHFSLQGMLVECRLLEEGQTFENMQEIFNFIREKDPDFLKSLTKKDLFLKIARGLDEWIDWDTNVCHFNDGAFESMLEFCNEAASTMEEATGAHASVASGNVGYLEFSILQQLTVYDHFADIQGAEEYVEGLPNGDVKTLPVTKSDVWAWVWLPTPSTVYDGYEISPNHLFAVVEDEKSREAAEEFLRYHFLEDIAEEIAPDNPEDGYFDFHSKGITHFPINQEEFDRFIGRNLAWNGEDKKTRLPMERRRYEDTVRIVRAADHLVYNRNAVFDVMNEEAYRYFAGDITAKQAAEYVQNRISIYLAEQG